MDYKIILPDDKTIEKMAKEYSKIKAKTFSSNAVEVLSADKRRKYTLVAESKFDYSTVSKDINLIILLSEHSQLLLRQINSLVRNPNEKMLLNKIIDDRKNIITSLKNIKLHGQIPVNSLNFPKYYNLKHSRQVFLNQFLILDAYADLLAKIPFGKFKNRIISLKQQEYELTTKILLSLY